MTVLLELTTPAMLFLDALDTAIRASTEDL
jgi:hypothetical protein